MHVGPVQIDSGATAGSAAPTSAAASSAGAKGYQANELMGLGKSDFLKLLVAQLRNQDPLKPMEDREFIAQMAQLNTVEQIHAMNASLTEFLNLETMAQASALIGKRVEAYWPGGDVISGVVQEVILEQGTPVLIVDGHEVLMSEIYRVS